MSKERNTTLDPLRLQAFYDGELDAEEARAVERALDADANAGLRLEALSEMSELLRFDSEQHLEDVSFDGLWARISDQLPPESSASSAASAASAPSAEAEEGGWFERFRASVVAFFTAHQRVLVPALGVMIVAGAIGVPMLLNEAPSVAPELGPDDTVADAAGATGDPAKADPANAVDLVEHKVVEQPTLIIVQQPDFENDAMGTVQYTPDSKIPVIWYLGADGGAGIVPTTPGGGPASLSPNEVPPWVPMMIDYMERLKKRTQQGLPIPTGRSTGEEPL